MADVQHEPLEMSQVMDAHENRSEHFARRKKVPQIRPGELATGQTVARRVDRLLIVAKTGILEPHLPIRRKRVGIAAVAGRQHAIEHVHPRRDGRDDVPLVADAHQIPRFIGRQQRGRVIDHPNKLLVGLPDGHAADRKAG